MRGLTLYALLNRLFPDSFRLKLFFVAFVGAHAPLVALLSLLFVAQGGVEAHARELVVTLAATIAGVVFALSGIWLVLAPVEEATAALNIYRRERRIAISHTHFRDTAGRLSNGVHALLVEVENLLGERERLAATDALTTLLNRRGFEKQAGQFSMPESNRCVALFDLDHFKAINDHFGHPKGDDVLTAFAGVLKTCARDIDIVGRLGGEEFAILFVDLRESSARDICDRIRAEFSSLKLLPYAVTTSVGLAAAMPGESLSQILSRADRALYQAKRSGRNQIITDVSKAA